MGRPIKDLSGQEFGQLSAEKAWDAPSWRDKDRNGRRLREQAFGEALDPDKLERLGRYEIHLDRKLERMLAMLLRLKDLRREPVEPESGWQKPPLRELNARHGAAGVHPGPQPGPMAARRS